MATTIDDTSEKKLAAKHTRGRATVADKYQAEDELGVLGNYKVSLGNLLERRPTFSKTNLLYITTRFSKIDPLAEQALTNVKNTLDATPQKAKQVIEKVTKKGWATELMAVNKRLNRLQISENKRLVLAAVYPAILFELLDCEDIYAGSLKNEKGSDKQHRDPDKQIEESLEDTVGFTDNVIYRLEEKDGALDLFAEEIVNGVCDKNRIDFSEEAHLRDLIIYQVREGL